MAEFLANCLHGLEALGPGGLWAVMGALFLAGLAGGATHCAAMCGPFVLAQAAAMADRSATGGRVQRLSGAALLPYHLGRALGYGLLGVLAGGVVGAVSLGTGWRVVLTGMLAVAAMLMFAQASTRIAALLPRLAAPRLPGMLEARLGPLLAAPTGLRGVALGVLLSALPCGLLYGALAGAAATGSALGGALAMLSFVAGTMPALIGVALLGRFFGKSHGRLMRSVAAGLFLLNGVVLAVMAVRMLG
ncbi:MAG: sulfite exporter TauE/SafE family protein [Roseomonas sp.]|nr:sulfite exporter TauE/SafE family protein [Roseomonas sp.]